MEIINKSQYIEAILEARDALAKILDSDCSELVEQIGHEGVAEVYRIDLQLCDLHHITKK